MKKYVLGVAVVLLASAFMLPPKKKIKIFLAGDSTISIKETKAHPETGWGMPFVYFWDSTVTVVNKARNGRSTKTFVTEGIWQSILSEMQEGDYVFIQFGHNDEVKEKVNSYTTPEQYSANLTRFIQEVRDRKGKPVLLTAVSRRKFEGGKQVETHHDYSILVRNVAKATAVSFIDLDVASQQLYQQVGEEPSRMLFLQLQPGEHPNYPDGKVDNTHFSELGARLVAQIVLKEIRTTLPELQERIVVPVKK
ncbi:rhamnogalacturonan acetylesterase [Cnuella takakiae]|nr:rhamnogalacturonan acetylesterase [Cnuella takakiae]OLY92116.1 GntR family transcriptional regulator [Cnuella takakiae]